MLSQQIKDSASLLDSLDAMRNWRALALLMATLVAASLVMGVGTLLAGLSYVFVLLFALAAYGVLFYGANAAGVMLMDEARGLRSRSILNAVTHSLSSSHRLLLVYLWIAGFYLAGLLVLLVLLYICKLPLLGPLLYAVVFPLAVALVGLALFALPMLIFPLSAPSVWNGASAMECVSQLIAIARRRLGLVLVLMLVVAFISALVALLLAAVLFGGVAVVAGLSAPMLGDLDIGGMGNFGMGSSGAHAVAAGFGASVLFAAAFTLPGLVYLRGVSTVYLRALDGIDIATEQADVEAHLVYAREKARSVQEQAQARAQQMAERARSATVSRGGDAPEPAAPPARCPRCDAVVLPQETQCAACGQVLP